MFFFFSELAIKLAALCSRSFSVMGFFTDFFGDAFLVTEPDLVDLVFPADLRLFFTTGFFSDFFAIQVDALLSSLINFVGLH